MVKVDKPAVIPVAADLVLTNPHTGVTREMPAYEKGDSRPVMAALNVAPEPNMFDEVTRLALARQAFAAVRDLEETEEEANDFAIDDDFGGVDRTTPWELDVEPSIGELRKLGAHIEAARRDAASKGLPMPELVQAWDDFYRAPDQSGGERAQEPPEAPTLGRPAEPAKPKSAGKRAQEARQEPGEPPGGGGPPGA